MSADDQVRILDGTTFMVCNGSGDIETTPEEPSGLFAYDMRILSKWVLTINGERLSTLSIDDVHYFESRFFLVPGRQSVYVNSKLSIVREQTLDTGLQEELTILNHDDEPIDLAIRIEADADFADIFEVKDPAPKRGKHRRQVEKGRLLILYERDRFRRESIISATAPADFDESGLTIKIRVEGHSRWSTKLSVLPDLPLPRGFERLVMPHLARLARNKERDLKEWLVRSPRLETCWEPLHEIYRQSLVDLAALRFSPFLAESQSVPAAGLPWFMCLFGRDSIFTCLQALPFAPDLAATTLQVLAFRQGSRIDVFREEEPGRILHEMRYGELSAFEQAPHSPYFGSADATPLFVVLLDEYARWTGDVELVRRIEQEARAALNWIDEYADLMGNGYISYERRNRESGLENQSWKDSWDSISYHDGRLPGFPRATCELQGYAYDAKMRGARLAREVWADPALAEKLEGQAANLKERFNRDFWLADRRFYALALDGDGGKVDALASNIGHLLWSGIVDEDKAADVVNHLMSPRMFNGWGVRTLAATEGRYNPIGYHVGTVWPFDNSIIAWGLRRYGYPDEAARLAAGILDAAVFFEGRLPEAFGGYERVETKYPVRYPTACSPQAWSAGASLLFLRTMLGLEAVGDNMVVKPALPDNLDYIQLLDIPGRWGRLDAFGRGAGATRRDPQLMARRELSAM